MWGWDISSGKTIYFDNYIAGWNTPSMQIKKSDNSTYNYTFTHIGSTTFYYQYFSGGWGGYDGIYYFEDGWAKKSTYECYNISNNAVVVIKGIGDNAGVGFFTNFKKAYASTRLYFDATPIAGWGDKAYLRYGFDCVAHADVMTKFPGTANLWYIDISEAYYEKYTVANAAGYTHANTVYQPTSSCKPTDEYEITKSLNFSDTDINGGSSGVIKFIPTTKDNTSDGCDWYNYDKTDNTSIPTQTVTINSTTNGTIRVSYYNISGTSTYIDVTTTQQVITVPQSAIITVTATENTGYENSALSVGGNSFVSGNTYTVTGATTITASFSPIEYDITYKDCGGGDFSGNHADGYPTTHTYGTATTLKSASKEGTTFLGWYADKTCTGTAITSLGATAYTEDITLYAKWTTTLYDSYFYQTYSTTGKTTSALITGAGFPFYINTDISQNGTGHPSLASEISTPYDFTNISLESNSSYLKAGGNITLTAVADVKAVHFYGYQREGYTFKKISTTVTHEYGEGSSFSVADVVTSGSESATQQIGDFVVYLSTTDGSSARANYNKEGYYTYNFNLGGNFWLFGIYVEKETHITPSSVTVNKTDTTLIIGETITASATISPDNTTVKTVTWTSSNTDAATVSDAGVVTAVGEGTTTITATVDGESASFVVTVESCESFVGTIYRMSPTTAHTVGSAIAVGQKDNYSAYADIYRGGRVWIGNGKAEGTVPQTDWCFYSQNGGVQLQMWSNGGYAILNLNCALRNGDTIQYVEGYNTSGKLFNGNIAFTTSAIRNTTYKTDGDHKYVVTDGDSLDGADSIYIWQGTDRSAIRSIEVRRPLSVVYDANGADSGSEPSVTAYAAGATATVAGNTGGLAKDGYMFYGWNTKSDGTGTFYRVGDTFTMPGRTTTLYAMWTTFTTETFYYGQVRIEDGDLSTGGGKTLQFFTESSGTFAASTALSMTPEPNRSSSRTYDSNDMSGLTTEGNWSASGGATPYILTERFYRTIDKGVSVSPYKLALGNRFATSITFYGHFNRNEDQTITIGGVERHTPTTADTFFYREFTKSGDFTDTVNIDLSYGELYGMLKIVTQKPSGVPVVTFSKNCSSAVTDLPAEQYVPSGSKIIVPTETPVRKGFTFDGWYKEEECTNAWDWTTDAVSVNTTLYAKWIDNAYYFTGTTDSDWNKASNWSKGAVPTIDHDVVITKPVEVNVTDARAKSVVLDQYSDNTGSLTISAGKELAIAGTLRKKDAEGATVATAAADITIGSDEDGNGALVMGTHDGTNEATVNFYTLSHGAKNSSESVNQYIGIPFTEATILSDYYNSWMYKIGYDADNYPYWVRITDGNETLNPFVGYSLISADGAGHVYEMSGTLVATTNRSLSLVNNVVDAAVNEKNENLLANSWTAPIKIDEFDEDDFTNAIATIYIFNSGSPNDAEDDKTLAGQYSTYPIASAEGAVIPSMQSFSVYSTGSSASVSLNYERLVYSPAVASTAAITPNKVRRDVSAVANSEAKLRIYVQAESGYSDMVYMREREDFAEGFENGYDGHKIFGESVAPQLYAVTPDGNMAVNCVPDLEGTILGFKAATSDSCTITFEYDEADELYLLDTKEGTYTRVETDGSYRFGVNKDDVGAHNRFVLTRYNAPQTPTGGEEVRSDEGQGTKAVKFMNDNKMFILYRGVLYDGMGKRVEERRAQQ